MALGGAGHQTPVSKAVLVMNPTPEGARMLECLNAACMLCLAAQGNVNLATRISSWNGRGVGFLLMSSHKAAWFMVGVSACKVVFTIPLAYQDEALICQCLPHNLQS